MVYCTQTIRINDDIARPAGYIACSIKNKENLQLFEEWEKESHAEIYIRIETKSLFNSTN